MNEGWRAGLQAWRSSIADFVRSRIVTLFVRADEPYPSFYYRYSYDIAHVFGLRIFGAYADNGVVKWRRPVVVANMLLILTPIGLGVLACNMNESTPTQLAISVFWVSYFSVLSLIVQAFSIGGVHVFHSLTPALEACLTPKGMRRYEKWASVSTATAPQLGFALTCVLIGCLCLWALSGIPALAASLHVTWASYVAVAISVTYLSGGVWWVFAGSILSWFLAGEGCMRLSPYAPAMTPGIELLVRCYRLTFVAACVGVMVCLTPIITWTSAVPNSAIALGSAIGLSLLSFIALMVLTVLPDWMLSKAILRERHRLFNEIEDQLPPRPSVVPAPSARESYLLTWMETLASGPRGTINESVVISVVGALFSAAVPVVLGRLLGQG